MFSIFTCSEYRKHGCLKISDFKHLSSEYRKLRFKKFRGFQTSVFSIFTYSEYRKHGCLKISDFLKSKFSIFTIGEYRKNGFIKVGGKKSVISAISEKSAFSIWLTTSLHTFIFPLLWETGYHRNRGIFLYLSCLKV